MNNITTFLMESVSLENLKECILTLSFKRDDSLMINYRNFHNLIKRKLIVGLSDFLRNSKINKIFLLDISVGKGGDIDKWSEAKITGVFGFDNNEESIVEANKRYSSYKNKCTHMEFHEGDATNISDELTINIKKFLDWYKIKTFNLVSCQFAIHYYFKDNTILEKLLQFVGESLTKGGYFFCTTMNGDYLQRLGKLGHVVIDNDLFTINLSNVKGGSYTIKTKDNPGNYLNEGSTEYLVTRDRFTGIASNHKLNLISTNPFEKPDRGFSGNEKAILPDHGLSVFPFSTLYNSTELGPKFIMNSLEQELNSFYIAYVFQKS
jgi:SAM-dependent methyltransferase